jgi:predicted flap endonuclease-1-like 5' DNA nuclease
MLYTAGEILLWMILAFLLGLLVGWLLWRWARLRVSEQQWKASEDQKGAQRLRIAELEKQNEALRAARARDLDAATAAATTTTVAAPAVAPLVAEAPQTPAAPEAAAPETPAPAPVGAPAETEAPAPAAAEAPTTPAPEATVPDLAAGASVLGKKVVLDDLKIVEGIGPKIEELLHGAGITTWDQLASTPRDTIKAVLDAAGERFQIHEPATWPQQAGLANTGAWQELKDLQDRLDGGREPV